MKFKKTRIVIAVGVLLIFVIWWRSIPAKEEQVAAEEAAKLEPLQLTGWRGSQIVEAPVAPEWSRTVIKRENQDCSFQGLNSDQFTTKNGKGKEFGPYDTTPIPQTVSERTFRFQTKTGNEPVKVLVTWETK